MEAINQLLEDESSIASNPTIPIPEIPYTLSKDDEEEALAMKVRSLRESYIYSAKKRYRSTNEIDKYLRDHNFLNDFNRDVFLKQVNDNRYWVEQEERWKQEKKNREIQMQEDLRKKCNYKYMYQFMSFVSEYVYERKLEYNKDNEHYIKAICFFLSGDERFETELGYSFKKGLWIRGPYGVGKTHLIRCLAENELAPIQIVSMLNITKKITEVGEYNFNLYQKAKFCIDDVGTEDLGSKHFGTPINWFKDFIENSYTNERSWPRSIVTTNCSFDEVEARYTGRVRSRCAQMFNIINVDGDDFRKK